MTTSSRRCALSPCTTWASHGADAFRYLAMTLDRKAVLTNFHRKIAYLPQGVA